MDYQEASRHAQDWVPDCLAEIARQHGKSPVHHEGSTIETRDDVISTIELGGTLIQMAVEDAGHHQFRPVLIVTERAMRVHRVGIGHQHIYNTMASGKPNFKKAVKNAIIRAEEIEQLQTGHRATKERVVNLKDAMAQELKGVRVPPDFFLARCQDGSYTLHIGTMKLTLEHLKEMCRVTYANIK